MAAAAGIPGASRPVVQFCHNGLQHTEGPAARDYERERKRSGFHLFFSTFLDDFNILPVSDAYA